MFETFQIFRNVSNRIQREIINCNVSWISRWVVWIEATLISIKNITTCDFKAWNNLQPITPNITKVNPSTLKSPLFLPFNKLHLTKLGLKTADFQKGKDKIITKIVKNFKNLQSQLNKTSQWAMWSWKWHVV